MITEEFSFPTVTNTKTTIPHFTVSPFLWRVSSPVYPDNYNLDEEDYNIGIRGGAFSRNSFSYLESKMKREIDGESQEYSVEKMDMLWEDVNEELQRVSSMDKKKKEDEKSSRSGGLESESEDSAATKEMVELCSLQSLKISKSSKRPNKVVVKILKKLFLLRNSAQIKKNS